MLKAKHQQLFDILKEEFQHGAWAYGEKLPNLTAIAEKYSVSINIASKTIGMLKDAGMVETKVGDGIYSTFKVTSGLNGVHYAGDRIYGHYHGAKTLRILIEDNVEHQITFWNRFFQEFSSRNPDIEIDANYKFWNSQKENASYEAVIGGYFFLHQTVPAAEKCLSLEWVDSFAPDLYKDCILGVSDFSGVLPYGFNSQQMLAISDTPLPKTDENILDYLERLPNARRGYLMNSSRLLLASMGVDMAKIGTDAFSDEDARRLLAVFEQAKKLYQAGKLIWPHGKITDNLQMYDLLRNRRIQALGMSSNRTRLYGSDPAIHTLPYPSGKSACVTMQFVHISEKTLYPEEYLRLVSALLSEKTQKSAEEEGVFSSINRKVSYQESRALKEKLLNRNFRLLEDDNAIRHEAFYHFLGWEFFYFLEGKRGAEVVEMINRKIRYYYEQKQKETTQ